MAFFLPAAHSRKSQRDSRRGILHVNFCCNVAVESLILKTFFASAFRLRPSSSHSQNSQSYLQSISLAVASHTALKKAHKIYHLFVADVFFAGRMHARSLHMQPGLVCSRKTATIKQTAKKRHKDRQAALFFPYRLAMQCNSLQTLFYGRHCRGGRKARRKKMHFSARKRSTDTELARTFLRFLAAVNKCIGEKHIRIRSYPRPPRLDNYLTISPHAKS